MQLEIRFSIFLYVRVYSIIMATLTSLQLMIILCVSLLIFRRSSSSANWDTPTEIRKQNGRTHLDNYSYQLRQIYTNELLDIDDDSFLEVSCSNSNGKHNFVKQKSTQCEARKRVIPLKAPMTMSKIIYLHPSHVEVSWCSGYCDLYPQGAMSCMPIQLRTIEFAVTAVMLKPPKHTESKCFLAKVQEHVSCTCNCSVQAKHCHPIRQTYNKSRCRCECKDTKQQLGCEKSGKIWDPVNCACECPNTLPCSTGSLFDPVNCECAKIMKTKKKEKSTWRDRLKVSKNKKIFRNKRKNKKRSLLINEFLDMQ